MENHELRAQGTPKTIDNTIRSTFKQCPRKLYWFLRRFDYSPETKPAFFVWGAAWQEILTYWYNIDEQTVPGTHPHMIRAAHALAAGWKYWDKEGCVESPNNTRALFEKKWEFYIREFPNEMWDFTKDSMEVGWQFPLAGTDYFLGGSLDGRVYWPSMGILFLENKTSGAYLGDNAIASWSYSSQVKGYNWYGHQTLGSDFYGVLMNLMTKQHPGPRSKWTTPLFARTTVRLESWHVDEFETDVRYDIELMERAFSDWHWPMTTDHNNCTGGSGKSACLFRHLCLSDQHFTEANPLQYHGIVELETAWEPWKRDVSQEAS